MLGPGGGAYTDCGAGRGYGVLLTAQPASASDAQPKLIFRSTAKPSVCPQANLTLADER